jgi:magnesium chelatase family protein
MVARVRTAAFEGVDVRPVDAQVQVSGSMPAFTLVGPVTTLYDLGEPSERL